MNTEQMRRVARPVCPDCQAETPDGAMKRCGACKRAVCSLCWNPYCDCCFACTPAENLGAFTRDGLPNTADSEIEL